MHRNAVRVQEALKNLGAIGSVVELDESTRTAPEAAAAIGTTVAQIAKSMVFMAGDHPVLVITSGTNRVSTDKLGDLVGGVVSRADADAVRTHTGFPIGGVPPIGHNNDLQIFVDEDLLQFEEIWAAAGTPRAVFPTTPKELVRMTDGVVADIRDAG
jgi:prolyl-tRNA editing enzyme YbaK/EbsC (Cys-tRNA(Pro) deacylase)